MGFVDTGDLLRSSLTGVYPKNPLLACELPLGLYILPLLFATMLSVSLLVFGYVLNALASPLTSPSARRSAPTLNATANTFPPPPGTWVRPQCGPEEPDELLYPVSTCDAALKKMTLGHFHTLSSGFGQWASSPRSECVIMWTAIHGQVYDPPIPVETRQLSDEAHRVIRNCMLMARGGMRRRMARVEYRSVDPEYRDGELLIRLGRTRRGNEAWGPLVGGTSVGNLSISSPA